MADRPEHPGVVAAVVRKLQREHRNREHRPEREKSLHLNLHNHRISTTEVESALVSHPAVAESAVIGRDDPLTGQAIFAFVTLRGGHPGDETLSRELRAHVVSKIGSIARPKTIMFTPELPKTRSGKIMRRLLRDIANDQTLGDTTTLADATVVESIRTATVAGKDED